MSKILYLLLVLAVFASTPPVTAQADPQIYTFPSGATFIMPPDGEIRPDSNPPEIQIGRSLTIEMVDPVFIGITPRATLDAPLDDILVYLLGVVGYQQAIQETDMFDVSLSDGRVGRAYEFINSADAHQIMMVIRLSDRRVGALNIRSRNELTNLQRGIVLNLAASFDIKAAPPDVLFDEAQAAFDAENYAEAADLFGEVIALDETAQQAHYLRGQALLNIADLNPALSSYERAYELAPDQTHILSDIAAVHVLLDDIPAASAALESRVAAEGEKNVPLEVLDTIDLYRQVQDGEFVADFYVARARKLSEIGLHESALFDLETALDTEPDNAAIHAARGDIFMQMEQYDDAVDAYTDALLAEPLPLLFYFRGMARQALGETQPRALGDALHDYQCLLLLADETIGDDQVKAAQRAIETVVVTTSGYLPITDPSLCVP